MNEVRFFENSEIGKVRVVMKDGDPWFVARDVAEALKYADTDQAVRMHCNYAELFKPVKSMGFDEQESVGPRGLKIIPEADVYALIFRSHLPKAKKFRDWVFRVVLPSIRKTGGYGVPAGLPDFTDPVAAARAWADEYEGKMLAQATAKAALAERNHTIKTKAQIGSRREATSMATASVAVRRAVFLADKMGEGTTYKSVIAIPWLSKIFALSKGLYPQLGKTLRRMSEDLGFDVREVPDSRYGTVEAYHVDVIDELYFRLTQDKNMLRRYRKAD